MTDEEFTASPAFQAAMTGVHVAFRRMGMETDGDTAAMIATAVLIGYVAHGGLAPEPLACLQAPVSEFMQEFRQ